MDFADIFHNIKIYTVIRENQNVFYNKVPYKFHAMKILHFFQ